MIITRSMVTRSQATDQYLHYSTSLDWVLNYLASRKQFVQVNDKQSELTDVLFGVPQGSILGPFLFNLYVNDLQSDCTLSRKCPCFQYADDTTLYKHSTPKELSACEQEMKSAISSLEQWATGSNLLLNGKKTKQMLVTTQQMSRTHGLGEITPPLTVKDKTLERVRTFKLLGTWLNEHLKWSDQVKHLASSCYGVLATLRKIRNFMCGNSKLFSRL